MAKGRFSFPTFRQPKIVSFGTGCRKELPRLTDLDRTALFVSGHNEVCDSVMQLFDSNQWNVLADRMCRKPPGEPTWEMICAGAEFLRRSDCRRIIAIGGGSVLDWCRLAWAASVGQLSASASGGVALPSANGRRPEFWLVPTTPATGAEAAAVAVFSNGDGNKIPVSGDAFVADRVLLDGHFLSSMSESAVATALCDAISHAIESYVSIIHSSFAEDAAVSALTRILRVANQEPSAARNQVLIEASYLAGLAASNCSVGVVHAFAHTMALLGISHAHANGLGLLAGIRTNRDVPAMVDLCRRCHLGETAEHLADAIRPVVHASRDPADAQLAERLADTRFRNEIGARMSSDVCMRSNPKRLSDAEIDSFLKLVVKDVLAP